MAEEEIGEPIPARKGATVMKVAEMIHKDFARNFHYAKIWRRNFDVGVKVGRDFLLQDGDIVEFHAH